MKTKEKHNCLAVTGHPYRKYNSLYVSTKCDCGNERETKYSDLKNGKIKSCGCYRKEWARDRKITHNLTNHPLFNVWQSMKNRCQLETSHAYSLYGGRGVIVCDEWIKDFKSFYDWAVSNGWKKRLQVDRVNTNGNYEPSNCRMSTSKDNNRNRRNNKLTIQRASHIRILRYGGKKLPYLSMLYGVSQSLISQIALNKAWVV